jgi:hypothetical protein
MRIQKIAKAAITAAAAFALTTAPAFALVNDTTVINSGDDAVVNSSANQTSVVEVENTNTAFVDQNVDAVANTGGNDANENISLSGAGASINTGAATVGTSLNAEANKNFTAIGGGVNPSSANFTDVVNTGDLAVVNTSTNTTSVVDVDNSNFAGIHQSAYETANTGKNDANENIGGGTINSGAAGVATDMNTKVNANWTSIGAGSPGALGDLGSGLLNQTSVTNTGDDVYVNSNANSASVVEVENHNVAFVSQWVDAYANTGKNDANENIGGGSINTSPAFVDTDLSVQANANATSIWEPLGAWSLAGNFSDYVNTGDNLVSDTSVNSASVFNLSSFNLLKAHQDAYETSNSGWNDADENIGHSGIGSGFAGVGTGLGVKANLNATSIGGSWFGNILTLLAL